MEKILKQFKIHFWDFDGVLIDSMHVRDIGFRIVLKDYPEEVVNELLEFHKRNGGLSRYVKFRHFFQKVLNENVEEEKIEQLAYNFKKIMLSHLIDKELLIDTTNLYIKKNYKQKKMYITSGSDEEELIQICKGVGIFKYFEQIKGSPTSKIININNLILENGFMKKDCILIGDSINDYDAAVANKISFAGFNNHYLKKFLKKDQVFYFE